MDAWPQSPFVHRKTDHMIKRFSKFLLKIIVRFIPPVLGVLRISVGSVVLFYLVVGILCSGFVAQGILVKICKVTGIISSDWKIEMDESMDYKSKVRESSRNFISTMTGWPWKLDPDKYTNNPEKFTYHSKRVHGQIVALVKWPSEISEFAAEIVPSNLRPLSLYVLDHPIFVLFSIGVFAAFIPLEFLERWMTGKRVGASWMHTWPKVYMRGETVTIRANNVFPLLGYIPFWWVRSHSEPWRVPWAVAVFIGMCGGLVGCGAFVNGEPDLCLQRWGATISMIMYVTIPMFCAIILAHLQTPVTWILGILVGRTTEIRYRPDRIHIAKSPFYINQSLELDGNIPGRYELHQNFRFDLHEVRILFGLRPYCLGRFVGQEKAIKLFDTIRICHGIVFNYARCRKPGPIQEGSSGFGFTTQVNQALLTRVQQGMEYGDSDNTGDDHERTRDRRGQKMTLEEAYEILGATFDHSMKEITDLWRSLSKIYHPDARKGYDDRMKKINAAYDIIKKARG